MIPSVGDVIKWSSGACPSVWVLASSIQHEIRHRGCVAAAVCLEDASSIYTAGQTYNVYFDRCDHGLQSPWVYLEDDFSRWVKQVREQQEASSI